MHEMAGFMHFQALGKGFYDYFATHEGRHSSRGGEEKLPKQALKCKERSLPPFHHILEEEEEACSCSERLGQRFAQFTRVYF